jgi:hypothetical protein
VHQFLDNLDCINSCTFRFLDNLDIQVSLSHTKLYGAESYRAEQQESSSSTHDLRLGVAAHVVGVPLPALLLHDPEDALEGLDVAGDPERALVAEPELLLGLPEQLGEGPVAKVLGGDDEPPHLVADVHCEGAPQHASLARRRHRGQLLPLLEQLLKPHDVPDLVARPAAVLLLHC